MELVTKRGASLFLANFIRQVALTQLSSTKIIAYSVGSDSTVVATNDNMVLEDMIEFGVNLSSYTYDIGDTDYKKVEITFEDVLRVEDIAAAGVIVKNPEKQSEELLHALGGKISVTLFFRKSFGVISADDNKLFLENQGVNLTNISVINARFCSIKSVTFGEVTPVNDETEHIDIHLEAMDGSNEEELFSEIKEKIHTLFESIL